ncbi:tetratricopeptide repeat protein [Cupriavidus sp. 30B13]|uniref:tetratricopeptide repeat protein n=1 Tax=Cupriavidus sp. 30B13 TaxID=3384241 RepID=UPI003B918C44
MTDFDDALQAHRRGNVVAAAQGYRAAIAQNPGHAQALHLLGLLYHQQEQHDLAIEHIERAAALQPEDPTIQLNLGIALRAAGHTDQAIACFHKALALSPAMAAAHYNLGNAYAAGQRHAEAVESFRTVVRLQPDDLAALNNLGNALLALQRHREAVNVLERALQFAPGHALLHNNLGIAHHVLQETDRAIGHFTAAAAADPGYVPAHINLGNLLHAQERNAEAAVAFQTALACEPTSVAALLGVGNALSAMERYAEAVVHLESAVRLQPQLVPAWYNLGCARLALRAYGAALEAFDQVLRLAPGFAPAHLNRAHTWLAMGDYQRGWPEYEWRFQTIHPVPSSPTSDLPRWHGEALDHQVLLIQAEQGLGDTLQFVRFIPLAAQRAPHLVLAAQPELVPLLEPNAKAWGIRLIAQNDACPDAAVQCPLLSLPYVLGMTLETFIPDLSPAPYLAAPEDYRAKWRHVLHGLKGRKIGLAWSGRIRHNENRAIPLARLTPLLALDDIDWVILQRDISEADLGMLKDHPHAARLHRFDDRVENFADTAALVEQLDAVVSIDTSVAHLAGAMHKPLWLMLPFAADWRWFAGSESSLWYPTTRQVYQSQPGDWDVVIQQIVANLARPIPSQ